MEMSIRHLPFWMTFENCMSCSLARIHLLSFLCYGCKLYTCMLIILLALLHVIYLFIYLFFSSSLYDVSDHNKSVAVVGAGVRYYFLFLFLI